MRPVIFFIGDIGVWMVQWRFVFRNPSSHHFFPMNHLPIILLPFMTGWPYLPIGNKGPSTFTGWYIGDESCIFLVSECPSRCSSSWNREKIIPLIDNYGSFSKVETVTAVRILTHYLFFWIVLNYLYIYLEFSSMYNSWVGPKTLETPKTPARSKNHLPRNLCTGQLLKGRRTL